MSSFASMRNSVSQISNIQNCTIFVVKYKKIYFLQPIFAQSKKNVLRGHLNPRNYIKNVAYVQKKTIFLAHIHFFL